MTDTTCSTEDGDLVSGLCGGGELSSGGSGEHCVDGCLVDRRSKSRSRNVPVEDRVYLKSPLLPRRALLPLYRSGRPFELCAVVESGKVIRALAGIAGRGRVVQEVEVEKR